jgi:hypothetical protein
MKHYYLLFFGFIILSCYPKPKLNIIYDDFDGSTVFSLDNNILISEDITHEIELNLQKTITGNNSIYLIILECVGSTKIGISDSTKTTFLIDGSKRTFIPNSVVLNENIDPELILEVGNYVTDFDFIKKIAYGYEVKIKLEGNRKILYSQLSLDNKINLQNFIESFISLEEQTNSD